MGYSLPSVLLFSVLAFALGVGLAYVFASRKSAAKLTAQEQSHRDAITEKDNKINNLEEEARKNNSEYEKSIKEASELRGRLDTIKKMQSDFGGQLKTEFKVIAQELLNKNSKIFADSSQEKIKGLLEPFGQNIETFKKRVNEIHESSLQRHGSMEKSFQHVREVGKMMSEEAERLSSALRGNKQILGAWGEMQLESTLQAAGMVEGTHYLRQESYRDDSGKARRLDFVVNLPKNKHIVIDAKTTLNSYMDMSAAQNDEERDQAQKDFFAAIKQHIEGLSAKDYHKLGGLDSPMYVLMYIPIESAYISLLSSGMAIFDEAYRQNIILVSHTTLLPVLRTISNLWAIEESRSNARHILDQAGGLYSQLLVLADRLSTLGSRINSTADAYNKSITAFEGRQGLIGKIGRFRELSDKSRTDPDSLSPIKIEATDVKAIEPDRANEAIPDAPELAEDVSGEEPPPKELAARQEP